MQLGFLHGLDESGKEMPMLDPIAPKLRKRAKAAAKAAPPASGIREVFIGELDFAKLTGWEPLEGLKAFAEVR